MRNYLLIILTLLIVSEKSFAGISIVYVNGASNSNDYQIDGSVSAFINTVSLNPDGSANKYMGKIPRNIYYIHKIYETKNETLATIPCQKTLSELALPDGIGSIYQPSQKLEYLRNLGDKYSNILNFGFIPQCNGINLPVSYMRDRTISLYNFISKNATNGVILVGHSQGNFFIEAALGLMVYNNKDISKVRMVNIASMVPSSFNYINVSQDKALYSDEIYKLYSLEIPARVLWGGLQPIQNRTLCLDNCKTISTNQNLVDAAKADPEAHGIVSTYLNEKIFSIENKLSMPKNVSDLVNSVYFTLEDFIEKSQKTTILNIRNPTGDFIKSLQYPIYNSAKNKSFTQSSVTILTKSVAASVPDEPSDGSWINPIDPTEVILPQQGAGKPYSLDVDNSSSGFNPNDYRWQYKWSTKNDDILLVNNGKTATIEAKCKNACNNRLPIAMNMVDPDGNRHYLAVKVFFASDGTTAQPITCTGSWSTALFSIGMTEIASQSCQTGYTGSKSLSHICQSNGQWGQVTTIDNCTVIPPTITNCTGVWTNQSYAIGATEEKYASSCPTGSTGQVRSFHVCQSSGQWGGLATSDNCTAFLETPTNLYGSSISNGIQLTWSKVSGAVSYYVYKMGNFLQEVFDNIFIDTNVSNGSTYQYEVAAHSTLNNQNVTSPKSSAISTTYNAGQTGIVAPNNFKAARETNGIALSWQPVTGADAYYIYRYGYRNPITGGNMLMALGASDSAFIDYSQMGLISGQSYCYFIRAVKGNVLSPNSTDACSHAP